jgi:hypothetical protein
MFIPLSWLRDFIDISIPVPDVVARLTLAWVEGMRCRLHPQGTAQRSVGAR